MSRRNCRVLVVDDEPAMREVLETRLEGWGFPVRTAGTVAAARPLLASFDPHVVISDLMLPDATGLALLESLRSDEGRRTFILITAYGTIDTAVRAIKAGATDVLTKPLAYDALRRQLDEAESRLAAERARGDVRERDASDEEEPDPSVGARETCGIVGTSVILAEMWARLQVAASSDAPVLIVGESGTGKELVARAVHQLSARSKRPFVPLNAAAIPEALAEGELFGSERGAFTGAAQARPGLVELAHTGTLFLDEITEMPLALQPKLLRVLEDGKVRRLGGNVEMVCDVRLIAATNRDPAVAVEEGRFRHDLLYRVDVLRIDVPPLRDRKDDLPALTQHFLGEAAARYGQGAPTLSPPALARLRAHDWPGNVRELRNVIERAFLAARAAEGERVVEIVGPEHVSAPVDARRAAPVAAPEGIVIPHGATAAEAERIVILETLKATGNNKAEAARRLGLDVKTVRNKLKAFGADGAPGEPDE